MIDKKFISIARDAVDKASLVTRHVQQQIGRVRAMTKDDRSPVTIADYASQAVVARELSRRLGAFTLVAEESASFLRQPEHKAHLAATIAALRESQAWPDASESEVLAAIDLGGGAGEPDATGAFWTLDPIDGTKGFLRSQQYCIALALIERGQVTLGAMACPNLPKSSGAPIDSPELAKVGAGIGVVLHAVRGGGTFDPVKLPPRSPSVRPPVRVAESMEAAHSDHDASAQIMNRAAPGYKSVRLDSQCKYAVVARGQADVYVRLPVKPGYVERIWDHAAGSLIAQEAGCTVTDISGAPLDFAHGRGLETNQGIVVAPPELHAKVLAAIAELRPRSV